jgi:hypothetical protein
VIAGSSGARSRSKVTSPVGGGGVGFRVRSEQRLYVLGWSSRSG